MPGPCRPIELSIPLGRLGHPRGRPARAGPQLHRLGHHRAEGGEVDERLQLLAERRAARGGEHRARDRAPPPAPSACRRRSPPAVMAATTPIASAPTTSHGSVPTSSKRTRSPPNTGPSVQEREKRVAAVLPDDRQHAGHADADAAGHRLLDRHVGRDPGGGGRVGDRPQHRHRAAGVDHAGCAEQLGRRRSVTQPAAAGAAVVGGDHDAVGQLARSSSTEHSRSADAAPATAATSSRRRAAAPRGRPAPRRRSRRRPAAPARRPRGSGNGRPSGPTTSTVSPTLQPGQPGRAGPVRRDHDGDDAVRRPRRSRSSGAAGAPTVGPPTAKATNWPGSARSAISGAARRQLDVGVDRPAADTSTTRCTGGCAGAGRRHGQQRAHAVPRDAPRAASEPRGPPAGCGRRCRPRRSASMPCTAAAMPCTVVMHGMPAATAAVRIS